MNVSKNKTAVAIGDDVLIHDNMPRNQWKIGVVTDLHKGKGGLVIRSVFFRIRSGSKLLRPIEKLYPLEDPSENNAQGIEKQDKEAIADKQLPPVRLVAQKTTGHFTVVCPVTWPLNGSEAGGDLVLIQTSLLLLCKSSYSNAY